MNAITNRCTTLNKICCHTCEEWRKNMTATDTATSTMPSVIIGTCNQISRIVLQNYFGHDGQMYL